MGEPGGRHAGGTGGIGTIVVFVLGGITLSEIRELELLRERYGVNLLAGGSQILTPKKTLRFLGDM